jgi:hypothetical protein
MWQQYLQMTAHVLQVLLLLLLLLELGVAGAVLAYSLGGAVAAAAFLQLLCVVVLLLVHVERAAWLLQHQQ